MGDTDVDLGNGLNLDGDGGFGTLIPSGMNFDGVDLSAFPSGLVAVGDGTFDFSDGLVEGGMDQFENLDLSDLGSINIVALLSSLPPNVDLRQLWTMQLPELDLDDLKIDDVLTELGQDAAGLKVMLGEMHQPFVSIASSLIKIVPDVVDCVPKAVSLLSGETGSCLKGVAFASDLLGGILPSDFNNEQAVQDILKCMDEIQVKDASCSRVVGRLTALSDPNGPMMEFVEKFMEKLDQIMAGLGDGDGTGMVLELPDFMELKAAMEVFDSGIEAYETANGVKLGDQTVKEETEAAVSDAVEAAKDVASDDDDANDAGAVGPLRHLIAGVLALVAAVTGFN